MKDPGFALAVAYNNLLSGLTYNGKPIKLYDVFAANDAEAPYVIVGGWVARSDNDKDVFGQKGQIILDVFTRFTGNQFSKKPANDIANQITDLLTSRPGQSPLHLDGFSIWSTIISDIREMGTPSATDRTFRKVITVSHSINQD